VIEFLTEWLGEIWIVLIESGPYLLIGFFLAGLIKVFVPESWIYRHLGGNTFKSVGIASMAGVPIPLCSCSVIPTAISLKKSGASKGATTSFLISTPETGVDSIGITWALMDPIMTIMRPLAALLTALGCGTVVNFLVRRGADGTAPGDPAPKSLASGEAAATDDSSVSDAAGHEHAHDHAADSHSEHDHGGSADHGHDHGIEHGHDHADGEDHVHAEDDPNRSKLSRASGYAFGTLLDDLTPWFVLGFVISGLIMVLLPDGFFGEVLPTGWISMLTMLVIGVPMYICATASTPVAAALLAKGLDPGAALVLLLAGPATNIATIAVVSNFLGRRVLYVYLGGIAFFSLLLGFFVNWIYASFGIDPTSIVSSNPEEGRGWFEIAGGALLALLILRSSLRIGLAGRTATVLRRWCAPLGFDPTSSIARAGWAGILVMLWASTSITNVESGEVGFKLRFGSILETYEEPGLILHAPYPIESVVRVRKEEMRAIDFGFLRTSADGTAQRDVSPRELADEAEVLCGDENLLKLTYVLHYDISDARRYRFEVAEPEKLLSALTASAVRRVTAKMSADDILVDERTTLEQRVLTELEHELSTLDIGARPTSIEFLETHAPPAVHEAFRDVASAIEDKDRSIREATQYEADRLTRARGTIFRLEQEAMRDANSALQEAQGRMHAFEAVRNADAEAPHANRLRLRLETAGRTWEESRLILVVGDGIIVELWRGENAVPAVQDVFGGSDR
jgi:HflK protein